MVSLKLVALLMACTFAFAQVAFAADAAGRWSEERANAWYGKKPWLVGCNYIPAYAVNQLEMWQAETFDLGRIDKELGWAESLGFNSIRVFLHDELWEQDSKGFLDRMDQFLGVADKHHIQVLFVFFDGCWYPHPKPGKQPAPKPHTHNSGWVQSPSQEILNDPSKHAPLGVYVKGVLERFKDDKRVLGWDVYNEPDNPNTSAYGKIELPNKGDAALVLLKEVFAWAREVNPSQPLTAGVWHGDWTSPEKMPPVGRYCVEQSDVISFHDYSTLDKLEARVAALRGQTNRPLICTEYMARPAGSTFEASMRYLKKEKIAAFNWGFVNGKSQTIYPWDSWTKHYTAEPPVWFHDIFQTDGRPYREAEVALIRKLTGK